ncbi:MAG: DUF882 domain-containing protein [Gammaproteobacteria bacterium]
MPTAKLSRRAFLQLAVAAGATYALPASAAAAPRHLSFAHTHTGESLALTYWRDGRYDPIALKTIDHLLRDHRTGDIHAIEPRLLDFLYTVQCTLDCDVPFEVISGYRSPVTNEMLHRSTSGVASRSLHMDGRAIDVRLPGIRTARLRETAAALRLGGVGFYPDSGFVHLDTGRVRQW